MHYIHLHTCMNDCVFSNKALAKWFVPGLLKPYAQQASLKLWENLQPLLLRDVERGGHVHQSGQAVQMMAMGVREDGIGLRETETQPSSSERNGEKKSALAN